jgi:hypothetical protein
MNERVNYDPTAALEALAHEGEPPTSRLDVLRAAQDGYRLRARRRIVRMLTGFTAAGALAAVAVLVPVHIEGATAGPAGGNASPTTITAPMSSAPAPTASGLFVPDDACQPLVGILAPKPGQDYTMRVPAEFGWLPGDVVPDVNQGPLDYNDEYNTGYNEDAYSAYAGSLSGSGPLIDLYLYATPVGVPELFVAGTGCNGLDHGGGVANSDELASVLGYGTPYLKPGPDIAGRPSYWISSKPNTEFVGSGAVFTFETADDHWAVLQATGLNSTNLAETLVHVAATLKIGDLDLPAPIQIVGLPKAIGMQIAQTYTDTPAPGGDQTALDAFIGASFGSGSDSVRMNFAVYPTDEFPASIAKGGPCKESNGLKICAVGSNSEIERYVPGGLPYLLNHVVSLGPDPANWSPDLVVDSH